MVKAGLIAADAGIDIGRATLASFLDELAVGKEGPRHRDHVGLTIGQHLFGHFGRIDAVGGHQRDVDLAHQVLRHPCKGGAGNLGGDGGDAGLVPTNAGIDDGGPCRLDGAGQLDHLVQRRAAFDQIQHRQAIDDDEVRADRLAHTAHDLEREADAVLIGAAPFVVALVGAGGDELVDQIAFGGHDLDGVISRILGQTRRVYEVGNGLFDLFARQRMRHERVDRGLDRRRSDQFRRIGIAAKMQNLHGDLAVMIVNGLGDDLVVTRFFLGRHFGGTRPWGRAGIGGDATRHDQANITGSTLGIEGGHAVETVRCFFEADVHGAHQHTIGQGGEAEVQRTVQQRKMRHAHSSYPCPQWGLSSHLDHRFLCFATGCKNNCSALFSGL